MRMRQPLDRLPWLNCRDRAWQWGRGQGVSPTASVLGQMVVVLDGVNGTTTNVVGEECLIASATRHLL
jgi:hypothetical protein